MYVVSPLQLTPVLIAYNIILETLRCHSNSHGPEQCSSCLHRCLGDPGPGHHLHDPDGDPGAAVPGLPGQAQHHAGTSGGPAASQVSRGNLCQRLRHLYEEAGLLGTWIFYSPLCKHNYYVYLSKNFSCFVVHEGGWYGYVQIPFHCVPFPGMYLRGSAEPV